MRAIHSALTRSQPRAIDRRLREQIADVLASFFHRLEFGPLIER